MLTKQAIPFAVSVQHSIHIHISKTVDFLGHPVYFLGVHPVLFGIACIFMYIHIALLFVVRGLPLP